MAFFNLDDLSRRLTMVGQEAVSQTKLFTETTRINAKISDEEKQINNIFIQLGKIYFEANKDNPNAEYADMIVSVKDAQARIEQYKEQIRIAKGVKTCPQCGADVPNGSLFCNSCGNKMPEEVHVNVDSTGARCPQCGSATAVGASFCNICGCSLPQTSQSVSIPTPVNSTLSSENGTYSTPNAPATPVDTTLPNFVNTTIPTPINDSIPQGITLEKKDDSAQ